MQAMICIKCVQIYTSCCECQCSVAPWTFTCYNWKSRNLVL